MPTRRCCMRSSWRKKLLSTVRKRLFRCLSLLCSLAYSEDSGSAHDLAAPAWPAFHHPHLHNSLSTPYARGSSASSRILLPVAPTVNPLLLSQRRLHLLTPPLPGLTLPPLCLVGSLKHYLLLSCQTP